MWSEWFKEKKQKARGPHVTTSINAILSNSLNTRQINKKEFEFHIL